MLRIVFVLSSVLLASSCAIAPTNLRETGLMDQARSVRVVYLAPEKPFYKSVYNDATGGGGLIGYAIGKGIFNSAQSDLEPFFELLGERDITGEIYQSLSTNLTDLDWASVGGVEIKDKNSFDPQTYAASIDEDALITISSVGLISPKYQLLELVTEVSIYPGGREKPGELYKNRLIYQSDFYGEYKTLAMGEWEKSISDIKERYRKMLEHEDSPRRREQAATWRKKKISELKKEVITVSSRVRNTDGKEWLKNGGQVFLKMINEGVNGIAGLVSLELNDRTDRSLAEFTVVPHFNASTGFGSVATPMIVHELKSTEERRIVRVLGLGWEKNTVYSVKKTQPVISNLGIALLD